MKTTIRWSLAILSCCAWMRLAAAEPPAQAVAPVDALETGRALVRRVLPGHAEQFALELIPAEAGRDVFEYEARPPCVVLRGNNGGSLAVAFNQYLRHEAHLSYDWLAEAPLASAQPLPLPAAKVRGACVAEERFFLNYCTYGYTMPWWHWDRWQRFIDWMAMNGINRPLLQTGQEAVWLRVWEKYGLTADQVRAYFSAPAHLPWHRMANLDRWGGPLPRAYIGEQQSLQRQILARARALGMKPILSGFAGHVPPELRALRPNAKITGIAPGWGGMAPEYATWYLDPTDPLFAEIQKAFLEEQTAMYGTDHLYAADPFNELTPPSWEPAYLAKVSRSIYDGMAAVDPQATWYQMAWTFYYDKRWTDERLAAMVETVPPRRMVMLDYACEDAELYRRTQKFFGRSFIWNYLGNFGGNTYLLAPLDSVSQHLAEALAVPGCLGVGSTLEGLNINEVIYEMILEQPWHPGGKLEVDAWVRDYAQRRGGWNEPAIMDAWRVLGQRVLTDAARTARHAENGVIYQIYPSFTGRDHRTAPGAKYDRRDIMQAVDRLLEAPGELRGDDGYGFDVANLTRESLGNLGLESFRRMAAAYAAKDIAAFDREAAAFLELGADIDELLGTRREFLLGSWLEDARSWGHTPAEADYYERNAREIITAWHSPDGNLRDYASRQWNGLMRTYYLPRWKKFIELAGQSLRAHENFPDAAFAAWTKAAVGQWVDTRDGNFCTAPRGDPVETARRLVRKYHAALISGTAQRSSQP